MTHNQAVFLAAFILGLPVFIRIFASDATPDMDVAAAVGVVGLVLLAGGLAVGAI